MVSVIVYAVTIMKMFIQNVVIVTGELDIREVEKRHQNRELIAQRIFEEEPV